MEGGQNLRMKTRFNSSQVFSKSNEVLHNHRLAAPHLQSFLQRRFIEGINVVDRNGCDIFSTPKLPFGVGERCEHFCVATPSPDRERESN
ncbi:hypothetical protein Tco_0666807 [Tanacetum coccineum]